LEETRVKSKAMVSIGDRPILWHILKYYEHYGLDEFVIALGYQGNSIRQFFAQLGERRCAKQDGPCTVLYPRAEP
jgi:NDP-sugar pyrophosphorylase family protein